MQKYTIFFNDKSIQFINHLPVTYCKNNDLKRITFLESNNTQEFNFSDFFRNGCSEDWVIVCENNFKKVFRKFLSEVKVVKAAGGFVKNNEDKYLFIYRNNKWDLPKGKAELFENMQETALREVQEECGIQDLIPKQFICKTYHIYRLNNTLILKKTYWFEMFSNDQNKLVPQQEEGITDAQWFSKNEIKTIVHDNTYSNIKIVLDLGLRI